MGRRFSGVVNIVPKNSKDKNLKFSQQFGSYDSGFWNANGQLKIKTRFYQLTKKEDPTKESFKIPRLNHRGFLQAYPILLLI